MMRHILFLCTFLFIASCSSQKIVVQGYDNKELAKALRQIQGKTPKEVLKKLGLPAIHGACKKCGTKGLYRIIYLKKDMARFYLDISYNTDMEVDCFVLDLLPNMKTKKYTFERATGFYEARNCTQKDGVIMEFKQILDNPQ